MPGYMRVFFLHLLPRLLMMSRPKQTSLWATVADDAEHVNREGSADQGENVSRGLLMPAMRSAMAPFITATRSSAAKETTGGAVKPKHHHPNCAQRQANGNGVHPVEAVEPENIMITADGQLSRTAKRAIEAIEYITSHLRIEDEEKKVNL